ncbi:unnamed protein product, partial [Ectocarpus sp. 12 AP-2014]
SRIGLRLHGDSLKTLMPRKWLNDDVINAYMVLLQRNSSSQKNIFMNTFFYTQFTAPDVRHALVREYTSNLNTTGAVKIFVPVNHDLNHWTLIVIDVEKKQVISMDSFNEEREYATDEMLEWIQQEHIQKKRSFDKQKWTMLHMNVPIQKNTVDCGVFVCMFAAYFANDRPFTFTHRDMTKMRARMAWSILNRRLDN